MLQSVVLSGHVLASELFAPTPLPVDEIDARADRALASLDRAPRVARWQTRWPRYQPPGKLDWPVTDARLLLLAGTLDPQTPPSLLAPILPRLHGQQRLEVLPGAAHGTVRQSPVDDADASCGLQLLVAFLQGRDDRACVQHLLPVTFGGTPKLTALLLGTTSPWLPLPVSAPPEPLIPAADLPATRAWDTDDQALCAAPGSAAAKSRPGRR